MPMSAPSLADSMLGGTVSVDSEGALTVHTGVMYGPVDVSVELIERGPIKPAEHWDDVVELSAQATNDEPVKLIGLFSDCVRSSEPAVGSPKLESGRVYRVRVHTYGRDESASDELIDPDHRARDHILLQLWLAPAHAPAVIRMTSSKAVDDDDNSELFTQTRVAFHGLGDPETEALRAHNLRNAGE
ncbi:MULTISPECIES: hypothetical protein [unclassified Brevibacterium]|uniref:hypothetical protein n=1 Tax=unclassified Brevibacterium TaxID=2614124 RepID=UPI001E5E70E8|nr:MULTISPECIES: hypothetical protein [unclassified Brevibacterium]MCD1286049.1 hypothetical protein [Brevibacterium sp. CCUG 69071]MDK8433400.1 hypothetical protein [Brevibacterium sp. H-BE7]